MKRCCARERDQLFLNMVKEGASVYASPRQKNRLGCCCWLLSGTYQDYVFVTILFNPHSNPMMLVFAHFMAEETEAQSYKNKS